jgi:hypothetical protein
MGYGMARNDDRERWVWTWMEMAVTNCNHLKHRIIINNIHKLLFHLIKTHTISVTKSEWFRFREIISSFFPKNL